MAEWAREAASSGATGRSGQRCEAVGRAGTWDAGGPMGRGERKLCNARSGLGPSGAPVSRTKRVAGVGKEEMEGEKPQGSPFLQLWQRLGEGRGSQAGSGVAGSSEEAVAGVVRRGGVRSGLSVGASEGRARRSGGGRHRGEGEVGRGSRGGKP